MNSTATIRAIVVEPRVRASVALSTPTGMPTIQATDTARIAISTVIGARRRIRSRIGSSRQNEWPRSPRSDVAHPGEVLM